jgi:hypothetical protein
MIGLKYNNSFVTEEIQQVLTASPTAIPRGLPEMPPAVAGPLTQVYAQDGRTSRVTGSVKMKTEFKELFDPPTYKIFFHI